MFLAPIGPIRYISYGSDQSILIDCLHETESNQPIQLALSVHRGRRLDLVSYRMGDRLSGSLRMISTLEAG